MFEDFFNTVGILLTIAFWAVTVFLLVGGVFMCIECFTSKNGWKITKAIIAIIAGVFAFSKTSIWLESIPWGLFFAGCASCLVLGESPDTKRKSSRTEREQSIGDAFVDAYCEYSLTKAAVKDAIRELDK